jgi:hypothetical protein
MACDPLSFAGVDASQWASLKQAIEGQYGMPIDSEDGQGSSRGFTVRWTYDAAEGLLEIQCLGKPFVVPCSVVNGYIKSAAQKSGLGA